MFVLVFFMILVSFFNCMNFFSQFLKLCISRHDVNMIVHVVEVGFDAMTSCTLKSLKLLSHLPYLIYNKKNVYIASLLSITIKKK